MKARVFVRTAEGLYSLYKATLTRDSLCIISAGGMPNSGDHFTYHRDGTCFHHLYGMRAGRGVGIPWAELREPFTVFSTGVTLFAPPLDARLHELPKRGDIVLERGVSFGLELIIAPVPFDPGYSPDRPAKSIHCVPWSPAIVIEAFDIPDATLRFPRFGSPVAQWDWSRLFARSATALSEFADSDRC